MAASGRRAQEAIRACGRKKCSKHYRKEVIYICETCDILACVDCATQQHKGHELENLSNVIPKSKQKLQDFITRAEQVEIPRITEQFQKVSDDLSTNKKHFQNLIIQIKKKNVIVKTELDKITDTLVKTCHDMEHRNSDTLLNHQQALQVQLDKLSSKIQEVKTTLQSGNDVLVYDSSHVILSEFEDLSIPSCNTVEFIPGNLQLQLQQLEHLIGKLNITRQYQPNLSLSQLSNWRVMSEFIPYKGFYVRSMHVEGDNIWLCFYGHDRCLNKIISVNQKAEEQSILDMGVSVRDFSLSPRTGDIWFCSSEDKHIREVKGGRTTVTFTTNTQPWCICVTRDEHVFVGCYWEIVKYKQNGREVCRTARGKQPVVGYPLNISECAVTGNIAVVNIHLVFILDNKLQLLHTYNGEMPGQQPPLRLFGPCYVHFTNIGELLITDSDRPNKSVVLVTGTGKYLETLYTDNESDLRAVCLHKGAIWVSLGDGKIKVLKNI